MKEFFTYFFGQGKEQEFFYFSWAHILPILFMGGVIALIIVFGKKIKNYKHEERIRITLGLIMIITEMSYFWRLTAVESLNANAADHLPITVCGWAIIFSTFLVLTKNKNFFDIVYFWVLAGSTFGLLSPTVIDQCGPTRFRYYQFWLEHIMGFITLFYMMFVHGMRPNWKSILKSYGALIVLGVIAIIANNMLPGANYLFMADKTEADAITGMLPQNYVLRIFIMALLIGVLFFLAYLPWLILDIKRKKKGLPPVFSSLPTIEPIKIVSSEEKIENIVVKDKKVKSKKVNQTKNKNNNK